MLNSDTLTQTCSINFSKLKQIVFYWQWSSDRDQYYILVTILNIILCLVVLRFFADFFLTTLAVLGLEMCVLIYCYLVVSMSSLI